MHEALAPVFRNGKTRQAPAHARAHARTRHRDRLAEATGRVHLPPFPLRGSWRAVSSLLRRKSRSALWPQPLRVTDSPRSLGNVKAKATLTPPLSYFRNREAIIKLPQNGHWNDGESLFPQGRRALNDTGP